MSYIGRKPTVGNFQICDAISVVNGQAAYTMQVGSVNVLPETANHMIVSLNGVIQKPNSSFTVSGSTITFSSNLATGDVINFIQILGDVLDLGVPSDSTVSLAKLTATGTKNSTTFLRGDNTFNVPPLGGITMADQWRTNTNRSSFSTGVINQHWERVDTDSYGSIGSAMTESSGVFTFPATGRYLVMGQVSIIVGDNRDYSGAGIEVTTNNSSYNYASDTFQWGQDGKYISVNMSCLINVSDTSNIKVRLFFENESGNDVILGNTSETRTGITFIRMGDS